MNGPDPRDPIPGWDFLSDALGALSLGVLFLAALGLPHLI
jgi:hypothetical protein